MHAQLPRKSKGPTMWDKTEGWGHSQWKKPSHSIANQENFMLLWKCHKRKQRC